MTFKGAAAAAGMGLLALALPGPAHSAGTGHDFRAEPAMISNAGVHRGGEFVFQDYVLDDHGPNTDGLNRTDAFFGTGFRPSDPTNPTRLGSSGGQVRHAGDFMYAADSDGVMQNVADLVEFRVAPTADALHYRFELGALKDAASTVIGVCVNEDGRTATGAPSWPKGAGVTAALGCDHLYTVRGTGADVTDARGVTTDLLARGGAVAVDTTANTISLRVPRSIAEPGRRTWRYTVASGLWDAAAGTWLQVPPTPSAPGTSSPSGGGQGVPQVWDLLSNNGETNSYWREERQANDLKKQALAGHHVDVSFAKLASRVAEADPQRTGVVQRLYRAEHPTPQREGIRVSNRATRNYVYYGDVQPYTVVVPSTYFEQARAGRRLQFDQCLHPLNGNHNVEVYYQEVDAQRNSTPTPVVADGPGSNLGFGEFERRVDAMNVVYACGNARGEGVGHTGGIGFVDGKEVQREVERHYRVDADRNVLHGISLGSIGTFHMAAQEPDRYAGTVNAIFTPGFGCDDADGGNFLNVPVFMVIGTGDEFAQGAFMDCIADKMQERGNEYVLMHHITREHELSLEWEALPFTRPLIYSRTRAVNPPRVRYNDDPRRFPAATPDDGAVYWVSGMRQRDSKAASDIDVTSLAKADELPTDRVTFTGAYLNNPNGYQARFRGALNLTQVEFAKLWKPEEWQEGWQKLALTVDHKTLPTPARSNGFTLEGANLAAAGLDTRRMELNTAKAITGRLTADGPLTLTLHGTFPAGTRATLGGKTVTVKRVAGGIRLVELPLTAGPEAVLSIRR